MDRIEPERRLILSREWVAFLFWLHECHDKFDETFFPLLHSHTFATFAR